MKAKIFKGISKNGDLTEAIDDAIAKAKKALMTDHIIWKLETVNGRNGGFVLENIIEVSIDVK